MTNDILQGPLAGKIIRFALPVAFTIICEQLVNNTDVLLLGNFVGSDAMAAVGNDTPVIAVLITLLFGLSMGTNVIMACKCQVKNVHISPFKNVQLLELEGITHSLFSRKIFFQTVRITRYVYDRTMMQNAINNGTGYLLFF